MIIIPMGTDAPIYHWPRATVLMIALNTALFILVPPPHETLEGPDASAVFFDEYSLALGSGIHPVQWITHNFLHYGWGHLIGNMIFLWSFGIVVEGKLGILKYLAAYLLLGTLHGALVQTVMLRAGYVGHAAGASAIIFGLLAFCMVWAPRNELNCLVIFIMFIRMWIFHREFYYTTVAMLYIGEQLLNLVLSGSMGFYAISELGHLSGAFWGFLLATAMIRFNLVDCEGWDVYSLWAKRRQLARDWKRRGEALDRKNRPVKIKKMRPADADDEEDPEERAAKAVRKVRKLIDGGDLAGALTTYDRAARTLVRWPSQPDLLDMIKAMHAQQAEADSIPLMRDFCRHYPADATKMRLKLAQVLIRDRQRPGAALRVLAELAPGTLTPELDAARRKLQAQATRMQDEGVLELEGDD